MDLTSMRQQRNYSEVLIVMMMLLKIMTIMGAGGAVC